MLLIVSGSTERESEAQTHLWAEGIDHQGIGMSRTRAVIRMKTTNMNTSHGPEEDAHPIHHIHHIHQRPHAAPRATLTRLLVRAGVHVAGAESGPSC
jgi:hypothetical protein